MGPVTGRDRRTAPPDGSGIRDWAGPQSRMTTAAWCAGVGTTSDREADPAMSRLLAAALTVAAAATLAVGAALGVVALLDATPDQPNTPLITYEHADQER
jgi:hypothetical protein